MYKFIKYNNYLSCYKQHIRAKYKCLCRINICILARAVS